MQAEQITERIIITPRRYWMKRVKIFGLLLFINLLLLLMSQQIYADGIGTYISGGIADRGSDFQAVKRIREIPIGIGLVFDNNVSGDKLMNRRISIGYERVFAKTNSIGYDRDEMISDNLLFFGAGSNEFHFFKKKPNINRLYLQGTWGLGILRNESIRFWIGPEAHFYYTDARFYYDRYIATHSSSGFSTYNLFNQIIPRGRGSRSYQMIAVGVGLAVGLNIHISSNYSLLLQGGFRGETSLGTINVSSNKHFLHIALERGLGGYFRVGFIYRFNESSETEDLNLSGS